MHSRIHCGTFDRLHFASKQNQQSGAGRSDRWAASLNPPNTMHSINIESTRDDVEIGILRDGMRRHSEQHVRWETYEDLTAIESEAIRHGCRNSYLDTFDYQAKPFYQRMGYEVFGTLEDYPIGHSRFYLRKRLLDA